MKPVHSPSRRPTFFLRFSFCRSREQRSEESHSTRATGRAAAAPARVSAAASAQPNGRRRRRDPGGRRQQAAAATPAQPRIAGSQQPAGAQGHRLGATPTRRRLRRGVTRRPSRWQQQQAAAASAWHQQGSRRCYSTSEMGPLKVKDKLNRDIQAHVASVRAGKLSELCVKYDMSP